MAKGILLVAFDFSTAHEDEFHDWYDLEHVPERQRVPGFGLCERWISVSNPKQAVASYDLASLGVLKSEPYLAIAHENLSPWSKRVGPMCKRLLRFDGEQTLPGDAVAPAEAGGMLLVGMTPAPGVEAAFNAWYDREHVPALARVAGVLCARRFLGAATGAGPKYVALYHLTAPDVVASAAWKQASESTPMPGHVREQISDRLRLVCRPYVRG